ncbi:hypothetical protein G7K_3910-t1 [Saitoella complicata NRRL Y-17804]|uniref:Uncharacterized protein n=1 Tax=Saitoella complicata (strain BCRC 22490 / CBS 7301 / JCM 7358 / NBRC 10748 / NRRL Y-17804) TaxID=698492 RepID=A0A0E9NIX7_SAICN|nr:hypothetical protein G7K_3910-t1 [Saitoella complicata NRRL Y-17804]
MDQLPTRPFRNAAQHPLSPPPLPPRQPPPLVTLGSSPTQRAPAPALPPRRKPVPAPTASSPSSAVNEDNAALGVEDEDMADVVTLVDQPGVHPALLPRRRPVPTSSLQEVPIRPAAGEGPDLIRLDEKEEEAPALPTRPAAAVRKSVFLEELELTESPVMQTTPEARFLDELDTSVEEDEEEDLCARAPSEISRTDTFSSDTTTLPTQDLLEQNPSLKTIEYDLDEDYEAIALTQFPTNSTYTETASSISLSSPDSPLLPTRPNAAPSSPSLSLRTLMTQARSNPAQLRDTLRTHRTELEERVRRGLEGAKAKTLKPAGRVLSRSDAAGGVQGQEDVRSMGRYEDVRARVQARQMPAPAAALVQQPIRVAAGAETVASATVDVVVAASTSGSTPRVGAAPGLPVRRSLSQPLSDSVVVPSGAGASAYTARITPTTRSATSTPTTATARGPLPPPIRLHPAPGAFPIAPEPEPAPHPAINMLSYVLREPASVTYARLALLRNAADSLPMLASLPKPSRQTLIRCGLGALEARLGDNPRREVGVFATALGAGACVCEGWVGILLLGAGLGCSVPEVYVYWVVGVMPLVWLVGGWMRVVLATMVVMWNVAGLTSGASQTGDSLGTGRWGAGQGQDVAGWGTPTAASATSLSLTPGGVASGSRTPGPVPPITMANREVGWKHFALEGVGWLKFRTSESERARRAASKARKDLAKAEKKRVKEEKAKEREEERMVQEARKAKEREEERMVQEEKMRVMREARKGREREKALKKELKGVREEDVKMETEAPGVDVVSVTSSSESTTASSVDGTLPVGTGVLPVGEGTLPVGAVVPRHLARRSLTHNDSHVDLDQ